jgi:hypothetical protein
VHRDVVRSEFKAKARRLVGCGLVQDAMFCGEAGGSSIRIASPRDQETGNHELGSAWKQYKDYARTIGAFMFDIVQIIGKHVMDGAKTWWVS